jgi:hypothetical protein
MPKLMCAADGCKHKLDLVCQSLKCKCEKSFCAAHRGAEQHACSFDYKTTAKEQLLRFMSTPVVAKKVEIL